MIFKNEKSVIAIYRGRKALAFIYRGVRLVWQAIRSCYGRGVWTEEKPWIDTDLWKDNK